MVEYDEPHNKGTGKGLLSVLGNEKMLSGRKIIKGSVEVGFGHAKIKRCFRRKNSISKAQGM